VILLPCTWRISPNRDQTALMTQASRNLSMLSTHARQSCDTAQQNQPKRSKCWKGQKWGENCHCTYICSIVLCLWPGFSPNPQNERNSCNKETKLALSEHQHPNVQCTLPPSLYTHLVTCLPSSPTEALVSTHDLFLQATHSTALSQLPPAYQWWSQPRLCTPSIGPFLPVTLMFFFWSRMLIFLIFSYRFMKRVSLMIWYVFPQCVGRTNILHSWSKKRWLRSWSCQTTCMCVALSSIVTSIRNTTA